MTPRLVNTCAPQKIRPALSSLLFQPIFVVQPSENQSFRNAMSDSQFVPMAAGGNVDLDRFRNAGSQRRVRTTAIVVANELPSDPTQVSLVDGNQIIQTLAAEGPDESLAVGVGFRGAHWCSDGSHATIL